MSTAFSASLPGLLVSMQFLALMQLFRNVCKVSGPLLALGHAIAPIPTDVAASGHIWYAGKVLDPVRRL